MNIELRLNEDLEQKDIYLVSDGGEEMIGALYLNEDGEDVVSMTQDVSFEVYAKLYTILIKHLNPSQTHAITGITNSYRNQDIKADLGQGHEDSY